VIKAIIVAIQELAAPMYDDKTNMVTYSYSGHVLMDFFMSLKKSVNDVSTSATKAVQMKTSNAECKTVSEEKFKGSYACFFSHDCKGAATCKTSAQNEIEMSDTRTARASTRKSRCKYSSQSSENSSTRKGRCKYNSQSSENDDDDGDEAYSDDQSSDSNSASCSDDSSDDNSYDSKDATKAGNKMNERNGNKRKRSSE
jgi:hypothetical protein